MPKSDKLIRVHIQLYESDWHKLLMLYGGQAKRSSIVREVVSTWVSRIEEKHALRAARSAQSRVIELSDDFMQRAEREAAEHVAAEHVARKETE